MASAVLSAPHFHNEEAAYAYVEARVWPEGPVCPRCKSNERIGKLKGTSTRIGVHKCYACRKPFTVKVGTVFESSHVALHLWLQAMHLMCASKKGISSNQLHRTLGITLKSAWFMEHRIRLAMQSGSKTPFGQGGGDVEVDETYIGREPNPKSTATWAQKNVVLSLVDRTSGQARSFMVDDLKAGTVKAILDENVAAEARLLTDEAPRYVAHGRRFAAHGTVNHGKDGYVSRVDPTIHTNTVEGFYSVFKRGMKGTYQHCAKRHLHRYVAEFDFRYNNRVKLGVGDVQRAEAALRGVAGKRLTYRKAN